MRTEFLIGPSSCRTVRAGSTAWFPTSPHCVPLIRPRSESGSRPPHICALRPFRGQGLRGVGPGIARVRSTASSLESSDAPPWQLTSPPLSSASRSLAPIRRKICRSGEVGRSWFRYQHTFKKRMVFKRNTYKSFRY